METCYTLNDVAMMTGLTTRTLRNYLKMDVLKGTKVDGVWKFTERELMDFIENPYVKPSLQAKNRAIIFDFLAQDEKQTNEMCSIIDVCTEGCAENEISDFFCEEINKRSEGNLKFSYEQHGAYARVILKGYAGTVMEILNAYYS